MVYPTKLHLEHLTREHLGHDLRRVVQQMVCGKDNLCSRRALCWLCMSSVSRGKKTTSGMMSAALQAAAKLAAPPAVDSRTRSMRVPQLLTRAPEAVLQHV